IGLILPLNKPTERSKDAALSRAIENLSVPFYAASDWPQTYLLSDQSNFLTDLVSSGALALVRPQADADGVVRRYQFDPSKKATPMAWRLAGEQPPDKPAPIVRLKRTANLWQGPFTRYPAHAIDEVRPEWLANKLVLIGLDVPDRDRVLVAWSSWRDEMTEMPLVEFHAQALSAMKEGSLLYNLPIGLHLLALFALAGLGVWLGAKVFSNRIQVVLAIGLMVAWAVLAHGVFVSGLWLSGLDGWLVAGLSILLGRQLTVRKDAQQAQFVTALKKRYIAPELRQRVRYKPGQVHRLGQDVELALLSVQWKLPANQDQLFELESEVTRVCTLIADHGGFVVSAQSHQVLGAFNTPVELQHFKSRASTCAVRVLSLFDQLRYLSDPCLQLTAGTGQAGPSASIRPGGFWISGQVTDQLVQLQALHVSCDYPLLASEGFEDEMRDPNWEWLPVDPREVTSDTPLFTVRLASGRR
ncbi:MAG: CHASE2 domain-containing protein, partial [Limnobacter sp.]|nr:CHASE2 domain-containing protein [Limnobacter sp.]